jgi:hypothetical protein
MYKYIFIVGGMALLSRISSLAESFLQGDIVYARGRARMLMNRDSGKGGVAYEAPVLSAGGIVVAAAISCLAAVDIQVIAADASPPPRSSDGHSTPSSSSIPSSSSREHSSKESSSKEHSSSSHPSASHPPTPNTPTHGMGGLSGIDYTQYFLPHPITDKRERRDKRYSHVICLHIYVRCICIVYLYVTFIVVLSIYEHRLLSILYYLMIPHTQFFEYVSTQYLLSTCSSPRSVRMDLFNPISTCE